MGSIRREEWCAGVYLTKLIGHAEDMEDYVSMFALVIALKAINANNRIGQETAEDLACEMASLAGELLGQAESLSAETRVRLKRIRDTDPECAETATDEAAE